MIIRAVLCMIFLAICQPSLASIFAPDAPNFGLSDAQIAALPRTSDGKYAVYGDMLLPVDAQGIMSVVPDIWPNGIFVFEFDASVTAAQRVQFRNACAGWTVNTPIVCRERTNQAVFMRVHSGIGDCGSEAAGCSPVGFHRKIEDMYIHPDYWGTDTRTLRHEIGHALGKIHEQSRPDRDDYVDIHFERVEPGYEHNFDIVASATPLTEYDYDSIMHYTNCAFSTFKAACNDTTIDKQTIVVRNCARDTAGGTAITALDLDGIRRRYAPGLTSLLVRERAPQCGLGAFHPDMLDSNEAIFPLEDTTLAWRKVETNFSSTCGFAPIGFGRQCRAPKELIRWWDDTDSHPLNLSCPSVYEVWAECGCKVVTKNMACTNLAKFTQTYADLGVTKAAFHDAEQWRATRLLYFAQIAGELASDGLLTPELADYLPGFYQMNYLDTRLETKMSRARAGMYAYAHWKASIEPGYQLTLEKFKKIAAYRRLRIE